MRPSYGFTREEQDAFAIASLTRAQKAIADGAFAGEIAPVTIKRAARARSADREGRAAGKANLDKIPTLKPAFRKDGTVTAANSSSISDGAAALVLMRRSVGGKAGA
jgi:acetyl-CoA C-acetyltransferase